MNTKSLKGYRLPTQKGDAVIIPSQLCNGGPHNTLHYTAEVCSIFPTGIVGVALFVLRLTVAAMLLVGGIAQGKSDYCSVRSFHCHYHRHLVVLWLDKILTALYFAQFMPCTNRETPWDQNGFHLIVFVLISLVTAVLGPERIFIGRPSFRQTTPHCDLTPKLLGRVNREAMQIHSTIP